MLTVMLPGYPDEDGNSTPNLVQAQGIQDNILDIKRTWTVTEEKSGLGKLFAQLTNQGYTITSEKSSYLRSPDPESCMLMIPNPKTSYVGYYGGHVEPAYSGYKVDAPKQAIVEMAKYAIEKGQILDLTGNNPEQIATIFYENGIDALRSAMANGQFVDQPDGRHDPRPPVEPIVGVDPWEDPGLGIK